MISELPSGVTWRLLGADDIGVLRELTADCLAVDGGLYFVASDPLFQDLYAPLWQGTGLGGFDKDGFLIACTGVKLVVEADEVWTDTVGMVHPDHRRRGLGNALLSWCITEARTLFASRDTAGEKKLYLRSEFVTASALRLYEGHGFILDHAADVMRRDLNIPLPESNLPKGISLDTWSDKAAADFFAAYHAAFRERPGYPEWSAEFWISRAKDDADFSPERSFVAYDGGTPVGFITCFNDYVGQVGVHPAWRKRGLGSALLVETLQRVARAGGNAVWLDVNVNNPDAARVYAQLGFDCVGRRGTYALTL